ncbi:MAG: extracellular solute-binding protein [Lachnospiraceae bacterium]|nr:extracellular solute-binding protein [Lachnospiraceae bacterium]
MTKKVLALVLTTALTFSLAGCGSTDQEQVSANVDQQVEATDNGPVELTVWGSAEDSTLLKKQVDNFLKEYDGQAQFQIKVEAVEEEDCKDAVLSDMSKAADVFIFRNKQLAPLVAAGALSAVQVPDMVELEVSAKAFERASFQKELYAYPMATEGGYVLFFNKEFVTAQEAGGSIDSILYKTETLEKLYAMDLSDPELIYHFWAGGDLYIRVSEDGTHNESTFNHMGGTYHCDYIMQGLVDVDYSTGFASMTVEEALEAAKTDDVVVFLADSEWYDEIKAIWGDNCGVTKIPPLIVQNGQMNLSTELDYRMVGVNAYSDHVDWAHKLASYLTNEESQKLRLKENGDRPCNKAVASSTEATSDPIIKAINAIEGKSFVIDALPGYEKALVGLAQWILENDFEPYEDLSDEESGELIIEAADRVYNFKPIVPIFQEAILNGTAFEPIEDKGVSANVQ